MKIYQIAAGEFCHKSDGSSYAFQWSAAIGLDDDRSDSLSKWYIHHV